MWRADGWDVAWRLGVLTPHADVCPESELRAMAPPDIGIFASRVLFGAMGPGGLMDPTIPLAPIRAFVEPPGIDFAVGLLAAAPLNAIGFGFTSSSYVVGATSETAMVERLSARADGLPVVTTCAAAVAALRAFNAERVAVIHPPWFDAQLNELGHDYYRDAGFQVVLAASCPLPSDQRSIQPADLHAWAVSNVPDAAEAIVIGGNGFRAVGVIDALEARLGRPVVTANQVLLWAMLAAAGAEPGGVARYGKLFDLPRSGSGGI